MGLIEAPPVRPARMSLLNTAPVTAGEGADQSSAPPQRWELGYEFQPLACSGAWVEDPCDVTSRAGRIVSRPPTVEMEPFDVVAGDECSAFGFTAENYAERARLLLERCQSAQVANELWTGGLAIAQGWPNQYLASADTMIITDAAQNAVAALAMLEQAIAECGCGAQGMIHASRQLVTHWMALGNSVLRREGGVLLTVHDTFVVSDAGYPGTPPVGETDDGNLWAYATGMVEVKLGEITVTPGDLSEALDRSDNTVRYFASRPASASWDGCCTFAAEVDLDRYVAPAS